MFSARTISLPPVSASNMGGPGFHESELPSARNERHGEGEGVGRAGIPQLKACAERRRVAEAIHLELDPIGRRPRAFDGGVRNIHLERDLRGGIFVGATDDEKKRGEQSKLHSSITPMPKDPGCGSAVPPSRVSATARTTATTTKTPPTTPAIHAFDAGSGAGSATGLG